MEPRECFVRTAARITGGIAILGLYLCLVIKMYGGIIEAFKEWTK